MQYSKHLVFTSDNYILIIIIIQNLKIQSLEMQHFLDSKPFTASFDNTVKLFQVNKYSLFINGEISELTNV